MSYDLMKDIIEQAIPAWKPWKVKFSFIFKKNPGTPENSFTISELWRNITFPLLKATIGTENSKPFVKILLQRSSKDIILSFSKKSFISSGKIFLLDDKVLFVVLGFGGGVGMRLGLTKWEYSEGGVIGLTFPWIHTVS